MIGPAPILAAIVGLFHVSAYVFIRGRAGARLPLLLLAAWLGAWAGDTVGTRLAADPIRIGEFHVLFASIVAWLAIGLVAILATLVPERAGTRVREQITTQIVRPPRDGAAPDLERLPDRPSSAKPDPEPQPR